MELNIPTFLSNAGVDLVSNEYQEDEQVLGSSYQVQIKDVICGSRGMKDSRIIHPGNERFRVIIEMNTSHFQAAKRRSCKTHIVRHVVEMVRQCGGKFIRYDHGIWYDIGNLRAREKAGHALRLACTRGGSYTCIPNVPVPSNSTTSTTSSISTTSTRTTDSASSSRSKKAIHAALVMRSSLPLQPHCSRRRYVSSELNTVAEYIPIEIQHNKVDTVPTTGPINDRYVFEQFHPTLRKRDETPPQRFNDDILKQTHEDLFLLHQDTTNFIDDPIPMFDTEISMKNQQNNYFLDNSLSSLLAELEWVG